MYSIYKLCTHPTVDFAAEELKKYLRMMMPRSGEIPIFCSPDATTGFRLGLMADLGLDMSDTDDPTLDDIVYLETNTDGGVIAGSNPCALLIAVYRYLRAQGCRWLFPGVDGEWIPCIQTLVPVSSRRMAAHRYRGQCNEGAEFQQCMLDAIDFTPKIGMNTFMMEFDIPSQYYQKYYGHADNLVREPEPVTNETILQWKRQCEVEIKKRGLHFHDMGHGWTAEPFGLVSNGSWDTMDESDIPDETRQYLAELNGERVLYGGIPLNTNICFSNQEARKIMVNAIADYAEMQNNVDFLHIWLADAEENHCECAQCRKKSVSDWYVILLNEVDEELTRRGLSQHLVFIVYTDTFWAPETEQLQNEGRFTMLYAPISRLYTETYQEKAQIDKLRPFCLNRNFAPNGMGECLAYLHEWKKRWHGDCFCYEYHFWLHQYYEPTGLYIAKVIYDDIRGLHAHGLRGIIEDASQRSFFPNGFAFYVYGETLFDGQVRFEELREDYFSHAYGENWRVALDYLQSVSECFSFGYLSGRFGNVTRDKNFFNPTQGEKAEKVKPLCDAFASIITKNKNQPHRASSVAWRLLDIHRAFVCGIAEVIKCCAIGDDAGAFEAQQRMMLDFSEREVGIERYFDLYMFWQAYKNAGIFVKPDGKKGVYQYAI